MSEWGDTHHPSHQPGEPTDAGFSTGLVHCTACHALLRSSRGMATSARVYAECKPVTVRVPAISGASR